MKTHTVDATTILFFTGLAEVQFAGNWWILGALAAMMTVKRVLR
jgi:hypothetical protein